MDDDIFTYFGDDERNMMMLSYKHRSKFEYRTIHDQVVDILNAGIKKPSGPEFAGLQTALVYH